MILLAKILLCSLVLSSQVQAQSIDHYLNNGNVQLLKIDDARIGLKQEVWAERFARQQSRRIMTWIGAGTVTIGGLALLAYAWNRSKDDQHLQQVGPPMSNEDFNALKARAWKEEIDARRCPKTFAEHGAWFAKNTEQAVYGAIALGLVSFFVNMMNSSWKIMTNKLSEMMGSGGSEQFIIQAETLFRNTIRLYNSFDLFAKAAPTLRIDDDLHQKLRLSMARSVIIDNLAFVDSVEDCAACIAQLLVQVDDMSDQYRREIETSSHALCQLTNAMIERLELIMQDLCIKNDYSHVGSLQSVIQVLCGEFEHLVQIAGTVFYGEDFAISQAPAA